MDANAAARNAARQRWMEKDAKYKSESLKFWNREAQAVKNQNLAARGLSKAISNDYQNALYVQGKAREAIEAGYTKYFANKSTVDEGGRSRRRTTGLKALLRAQGKLESQVQNEFGANMQRRFQARKTKYLSVVAKNRQQLGIRPEYGAPVLMPPSDRLSGALSIASSIAGIYSGFFPNGIGSDIRLKENIKQVGVSPQGYKIYEFNYKGGDVRFRGAMAQDVLTKNPTAVGIDQNYLTVDYSKIDVNMEVV